jgi:DNA-binding protein HU-beta
MNKSDLIDRVSDTIGVGRRDAEAAINAVIHAVMSEVKAGQKVAIAGFGAFNPTHRKARLGRNPRTGEAVKVAASKGVRFAPGATFKNVVNRRAPLPTPVKTAAKKAVVKKAPAKRAPAKRAPARKVAARKTAAKKSTAKRASARKAPARKAAARRR